MKHEYWLSSPKMTVGVTTDERGIIIAAAPILRTFVGQPIEHLRRWMQGHGPGYREVDMAEWARAQEAQPDA